LDPAVGQCLDGNAELNSLSAAYNLTDADSSVVEKKVITYVTLHYLAVHKWLGDVDSDWHAGKYYQVGWKGGEEGHLILGTSINFQSIKKLTKSLRKMIEEKFDHVIP